MNNDPASDFSNVKWIHFWQDLFVSSGCIFILSAYHDQSCIITHKKPLKARIHIRKGAYIGANVTIFPGVTIGENSIIGACSLVNKSIPDNSLVYSIPARVVRKLDLKETA